MFISLHLGLAFLNVLQIPIYRFVTGFGHDYFYLDVSPLKVGEIIDLEGDLISYYKAFRLEYKYSDSYSYSDYSYGFTTLYPYNYSNDSYLYNFFFNLTKNSNIYRYLLLKTNIDYYKVVTIYHIEHKAKADYSWILWLVIGIITAICLLIFIILFLIKKTGGNKFSRIYHQPAVNDKKTPVDSYQPPGHYYEPESPPYVQPSYTPQYPQVQSTY